MSSVGGSGGVTPKNQNLQAQAQAQTTTVDVHADGSVDVSSERAGEMAAESASSKKLEADQAGQVLGQYGLTIQGGQVMAADSMQPITADNAAVVSDFSGAPPLPDIGGEQASPDATLYALSNPSMDAVGEGSFPEFAALFELVRGSIAERDAGKKLRDLQQDTQFAHKENAIESAHNKIKAERAAAIYDFAFSIVGALAGSTLSPLVSSGSKMVSKLWGPQRKVDYHTILEKKQELLSTRSEQLTKDFEDRAQGEKDMIKQALDIIKQTQQNRSAEVQRLFSG